MVFGIHKDGRIYPARETLDALEEIMQKAKQYNTLVERFSFRISNGLQI